MLSFYLENEKKYPWTEVFTMMVIGFEPVRALTYLIISSSTRTTLQLLSMRESLSLIAGSCLAWPSEIGKEIDKSDGQSVN